MDGIKVRAIACGAQDYKESDKLVTICSVEQGKLSVLLKGCRKPTSKLRFAQAPFCFGEYVLTEKGGYYTVTGCTPIDLFTSISADIDKFYAGSVILESLRRYTREGEEIARLVVCALEHLKYLCYENYDNSVVTLSFLLNFLKTAGYELDFSKCKKCRATNFNKKFFSYSQGGLVCGICRDASAISISAQAVGLFKAILQDTPLGVLCFEESVIRECLSVLNGYFAYLFGRGLNSLPQYLDISK